MQVLEVRAVVLTPVTFIIPTDRMRGAQMRLALVGFAPFYILAGVPPCVSLSGSRNVI